LTDTCNFIDHTRVASRIVEPGNVGIMNLFVGNLSPDTTNGDLLKLFNEFGYVLSARVIIDPTTGRSRQFGFVSMADRFEAFDAIDNLDMTYFQGQIISVKEAKGSKETPGKSPTRNDRRAKNKQ